MFGAGQCLYIDQLDVNPLKNLLLNVISIWIQQKNNFFISVFIINSKLCNVLSIMRSPGNGSILSEMECLNTRFPGSLCITCYVGIQCETQKI